MSVYYNATIVPWLHDRVDEDFIRSVFEKEGLKFLEFEIDKMDDSGIYVKCIIQRTRNHVFGSAESVGFRLFLKYQKPPKHPMHGVFWHLDHVPTSYISNQRT